MMNFDYLKQYDALAPLYRFCDIAERNQLITPQLSALNARLALEWMAKEIHKMKGHVPDERDSLYDLVAAPLFSEFINDDRVMMGVHYVRKIGNNAAHTGNVSKREAFFSLLNLYNFVGAVLMKLRVIDSLPEFDGRRVSLRLAENVERDRKEEDRKPEAYGQIKRSSISSIGVATSLTSAKVSRSLRPQSRSA